MVKKYYYLILIILICLYSTANAQRSVSNISYPIIVESDTLFYIYSGLGVFTSEQRAEAISEKITDLLNKDIDSLKIVEENELLVIKTGDENILVVTDEDALSADTSKIFLAEKLRKIIQSYYNSKKDIYSQKNILKYSLYTIIAFCAIFLFFWTASLIFLKIYSWIGLLDQSKVKSVSVKGKEVVKSSTIVRALIIILKGIRLILSLLAAYIFLVNVLNIWPFTQQLELKEIIKGILFFVFYTILLIAGVKGLNALTRLLQIKYQAWKGSRIVSLKIKSIELLSAERMVDALGMLTNISKFGFMLILLYGYTTIIFSLFEFTSTWAKTLFSYLLAPLNLVLISFLDFLPKLFFIIVLIFVFRYLIKFVLFIFMEIDKGNLEFPSFHKEWAMPTFKIVRFLIIVLAAIIIFPYLPGSDSPFFQGISVFLGILFSFGSSGAISNIVSGVVLTYMRPFKVGDRVKIAETMGDVIEKGLLVTRVRTTKNVDITVPNSMVLGSHIINYSSSSDIGLILHTTVTIGYDAPWQKVHELLISAASETEYILEEPKPFVLQTALNDFYVSYEINAYTNESNKMARIYSDLHSNIQNKFNEAGVEIMSPHYSALRDGNETTIPEENLPKNYKAPGFRFFGKD